MLRDIDPYVCLFEDCNMPSEQFKSTEEWIHHMSRQHTALYSCQFIGHEKDFFATSELFEQHLKRYHADSIVDAELGAIVQEGMKPAPDVFAMLAAHINQDVQNISKKVALCPLCHFSLGDVDAPPDAELEDLGILSFPGSLHRGIMDHIAGHLESIALLSLPDRADLDEEVSNELLPESTKSNDDGDDLDLSSLSFDNHDDPNYKDPYAQRRPGPRGEAGITTHDWGSAHDSLRMYKDKKHVLRNSGSRNTLPTPNFTISPSNLRDLDDNSIDSHNQSMNLDDQSMDYGGPSAALPGQSRDIDGQTLSLLANMNQLTHSHVPQQTDTFQSPNLRPGSILYGHQPGFSLYPTPYSNENQDWDQLENLVGPEASSSAALPRDEKSTSMSRSSSRSKQ